MDDVTDVVFRQVVEAAAAPDVLFTEFVSVDGLQSAGRERTLERLRFEPGLDRPLVAQIWGNDPEKFRATAADVAAINAERAAAGLPGFAGVDINMGCPDRGVVARGCGGGMIGNLESAAAVIAAVKAGAPGLPVSVKTRIGLNRVITEDWANFLLDQDLAALTVHGRTVREMSKVPARWDEIAKVVALRDARRLAGQTGGDTVIIGNGDAADRAHGLELAAATKADGIMIGRGIFHNLFAFAKTEQTHTPNDMLDILLTHIKLYENNGRTKPYQILKKFFKIYVSGWSGAAELRNELMETRTPDEAREVIAAWRGAAQK